MGLKSGFFRGNRQLEAAAESDPAHILPGAVGEHVGIIQQALAVLDGANLSRSELLARRYGPSTADAVLRYKKKRVIINRRYQNQADNIVGRMTMAALDKEMLRLERTMTAKSIQCDFGGKQIG